MTYTIFMLVSRKPGTSLAAFKHHYENIHMPLVLDIAGAEAPLSHTRHYLERSPSSLPSSAIDPLTADADTPPSTASTTEPPPLVLAGAVDAIDYDCVSVVVFADEAHMARFDDLLWGGGPRVAEIQADGAGFVDLGALRSFVVGEARVTKPER
jgi:hypothetical protein